MSAIIGIRCDECGGTIDVPYVAWVSGVVAATKLAEQNGWVITGGGDYCPFCTARRKAKQQAEATAK